MTSPAAIVRDNLESVFNEKDAAARRVAIERLYAPDLVFVDPEGEVTGVDAFEAKVTGVLAQGPDNSFAIVGEPREVGELGILEWALSTPDGAVVLHGTDIALVRDGVIARFYTLLG